MLPNFIRKKLYGSYMRVTAPEPAPDRSGLAIVAIVKNEARHIAEWADFHYRAGVRHFYIYNDASTDDTVGQLQKALPAEALTVTPWGMRVWEATFGLNLNMQALAYAHAVANYGRDYRWFAFIDTDEFLVPVAADTLPAALDGLDLPNLSLPWHMFGFNDHDTPPEGGMIPNYLVRAEVDLEGARGSSGFKMLADPCRVEVVSIHKALTCDKGLTWNDSGVQATFKTRVKNGFYSAQRIQLNHYYTRSRAELEAKLKRGSPRAGINDTYRRRVTRAAELIESTKVPDTRAAEWYAKAKAGSA